MDYYDRDGAPMTMEDWSRRFGDYDYKRVARTKVTDAADPSKSFDVSTVWLGLDHSFGSGPPVIFETMVFVEGSAADEDCRRYSSLAEARQGHQATVLTVSATLPDPIVMDA